MSTRIRKTVQVGVPFEQVKERVAPFGGIASWHPAFDSCVVEEDGDRLVRVAKAGKTVVRDQLLDRNEDGSGYQYACLQGMVKASSHLGYVFVTDDGEGGAIIEWGAKIKGTSFPENAVEAMVGGVMEMGLTAVKVQLEDEERTRRETEEKADDVD